MKKNIFVLNVLVGVLSIVQGAWGMDITQLVTLDNTPVTKIYEGIETACRVVEHQYNGVLELSTRKDNVVDGMLVKNAKNGNVVGVLVYRMEHESRKPQYPFELYLVRQFIEQESGTQEVSPTIDTIFQLREPASKGRTSIAVKITEKLTVPDVVVVDTAKPNTVKVAQLSTLDGTPVTQIYKDIAETGAFKTNDGDYTGHMMLVEPVKGNVCEAVLVTIEGKDGVTGVVVKKNIRPGVNSATPVKYEFCSMQTFHEAGTEGTFSTVSSFSNVVPQVGKVINTSDIKNGSVFHLKSTSGGFTSFIKIVGGNNSYSTKTKLFGAVTVVGIIALWYLFPDFFSRFFTKA